MDPVTDPTRRSPRRSRTWLDTQQLLFLGVVEGVDDGVDAGGEVVHAAAKLVVAGERGSFVSEADSLVLQLFSA
jgi:hypothetical protein